jgi:hypothetical protein
MVLTSLIDILEYRILNEAAIVIVGGWWKFRNETPPQGWLGRWFLKQKEKCVSIRAEPACWALNLKWEQFRIEQRRTYRKSLISLDPKFKLRGCKSLSPWWKFSWKFSFKNAGTEVDSAIKVTSKYRGRRSIGFCRTLLIPSTQEDVRCTGI